MTEVVVSNHTFCSTSPTSKYVTVSNRNFRKDLLREEAESLFRSLRKDSDVHIIQELNLPVFRFNTEDNGISPSSIQSGDY